MPAGYDEDERARRERENAETGVSTRTAYGALGPDTGRASDFDEGSADVPIWGWLSGAQARRDMARNEGEAQRATMAWQQLLDDAQGLQAEDLTPQYYLEGTEDVYGDMLGGPSELEDYRVQSDGYQDTALEALRNLYQQGGWTDRDAQVAADIRRASAMERGQQLRGANEAALQQSQARGMGGGGAELAARLSGSQALSQGQAIGDAQSNAQLQMAAMQRSLQAMQGMGVLGAQRQQALTQQEMARRGALDAFNQANTDWRRGRETRNTAWANRQQDARVGARQQAYENVERGVAGLTGQYQGNQSNRNQSGQRTDSANQAGAGLIGGILEEIL